MKINCSIDGKALPVRQAVIPIFDNALFYADGLFETFLAVGDRAVFLDDHLERLEKGARLININIPVSRKKLSRWISDALELNSATIKKVRVTLTAGDSRFWSGRKQKPRLLIIVTEHRLPKDPFRLTVSPFTVDERSPFRHIKTLSFVLEMSSRKLAYADGYDDAILLNHKGNVAETSSASLFWVKNNELFTPPLSSGCLEGMTRRHILALASDAGIKAGEKNTDLKGLLKADEIFISSSIKLILPVTHIFHDKIGYDFTAGKVTAQFQRLLRDLIFKSR